MMGMDEQTGKQCYKCAIEIHNPLWSTDGLCDYCRANPTGPAKWRKHERIVVSNRGEPCQINL